MSFFLNVALGAGLGPTAVAVAGAHVFAAKAGWGTDRFDRGGGLSHCSGCTLRGAVHFPNAQRRHDMKSRHDPGK